MIIDTLITDRTQADVDRLNALYSEGLAYWTAEDIFFFLYGDPDPLNATDGNLFDSVDDPILVKNEVVRGAYNDQDLNRVGRAVRYLVDKYQRTTLTFLNVTARTDWDVTSIPTTSDMTAYINDIRTIRNNIGSYADTPAVPSSMSKLTYQSANNIEKILIDANKRLDSMIESWRYAGEIYAGEV